MISQEPQEHRPNPTSRGDSAFRSRLWRVVDGIRKAADMPDAQFAEAMGMSVREYRGSRENRRDLKVSSLIRLCRRFDLRLDDVLEARWKEIEPRLSDSFRHPDA